MSAVTMPETMLSWRMCRMMQLYSSTHSQQCCERCHPVAGHRGFFLALSVLSQEIRHAHLWSTLEMHSDVLQDILIKKDKKKGKGLRAVLRRAGDPWRKLEKLMSIVNTQSRLWPLRSKSKALLDSNCWCGSSCLTTPTTTNESVTTRADTKVTCPTTASKAWEVMYLLYMLWTRSVICVRW